VHCEPRRALAVGRGQFGNQGMGTSALEAGIRGLRRLSTCIVNGECESRPRLYTLIRN
jgi:hypothetical protein